MDKFYNENKEEIMQFYTEYEKELRALMEDDCDDIIKQTIFNGVVKNKGSKIIVERKELKESIVFELSQGYRSFEDSNSDMKFPCVYIIRNEENNKVYVGSTNNLYNRLREHKKDLRKGKHHSKKLQEDYNLLGEECLSIKYFWKSEDKTERSRIEKMLTSMFEDFQVYVYNICNTRDKYNY